MKTKIESGSALFAKTKSIFRNEYSYTLDFFKKNDWKPLKIRNGQFDAYCINMAGITIQNENDLRPQNTPHVIAAHARLKDGVVHER